MTSRADPFWFAGKVEAEKNDVLCVKMIRVSVRPRVRYSKLDIYVITMGYVAGGERGLLSWEREDGETDVSPTHSR